MLFSWFNTREVVKVGTALADDFVLQSSSDTNRKEMSPAAQSKQLQRFLQRFLQRVDREARGLRLNIFNTAKLANTFKWRLLEKGVEPAVADELTRALLLRLSGNKSSASTPAAAPPPSSKRTGREQLLARGDQCLSQGAWEEAVRCYRELVALDPKLAVAYNNLGKALCELGRYKDAEEELRLAIGVKPDYLEAQCNLGTVLRWRGLTVQSETPLRRALKLKPTHLEARSSLGTSLFLLGRAREARECFEKVLRAAPRDVGALVGMGQVAGAEGRFAEAEDAFKRALDVDVKTAAAWSGLARLRRMTSSDVDWLRGAEAAAAKGLAPLEEANLRFAIGKYYDDVGDSERAFGSYKRANELQKTLAEDYDRDARKAFVDDLIRLYNPENLARKHAGASDSETPVFVVGMPRSGTTLVEQIISSHPAAKGAGELVFWSEAVHGNAGVMRQELLSESLRRKLASAYLSTLSKHSRDVPRVVDKTVVNSDYLGIIYSVFPRARMIYLRRDPMDTCLSCYFQQLSPATNYAMDLSDLAHYFREHQRLVAHWQAVLPRGALLEVPYAELTRDLERWTRKIVDFLGLDWDERCLDFEKNERTILTASFWQVRQQIHSRSVGRWRHYEKYIGPLLSLKDLA